MALFPFLLLSFAVYRLVRLWRYDTITEPLRDRIIGAEHPSPDGSSPNGWLLDHHNAFTGWLLELLTCPWCIGVHVAFWSLLAATASGWVDLGWSTDPFNWGAVVAFVAIWFAICTVAAFIYLIEGVLVDLRELLGNLAEAFAPDEADDETQPYA